MDSRELMFLGVIIINSMYFTEVFADDILIEFDKEVYLIDDYLTISGFIFDYELPTLVLSFEEESGKIISVYDVEIDSDGLFSKTILLDHELFKNPGIYKIQINYGQLNQDEFFQIKKNDSKSEDEIESLIQPEIILLMTDKIEYYDNETITISGIVSGLTTSTVLIGVYDPAGNPIGFYSGLIDSNLEFSTTLIAKSGVNFKSEGTYSIKAFYEKTEEATPFDFFRDTKKESTIILPEKEQEISSPNSNFVNDQKKEIIITNNPQTKEDIKQNEPQKQNNEYDNLSVEDLELGKILNQNNLECDRSKFVDAISYYDGMGPSLYRLCKYEQSLKFFEESLSKDNTNVEFLTNTGSALGKLGNIPESMVFYDRALQIDPNFTPAINNKANAFAKMENYNMAILLYSEAIEKEPNFQTARKNLTLVLSEIHLESNTGISEKEFQAQGIFNNKNLDDAVSEIPSKNFIKSDTKTAKSFFEEIGLILSSLGSIFGF